MKMHLIAIAGGMAVFALPSGGEETGRRIFEASKCQQCHTIKALGLGKKEEAVQEKEGDEAEEEENDKVEPPDLSGVGRDHDATWIQKFLTKKIAKESKMGKKKHRKLFAGSSEELEALSEWLAQRREDPPVGKAP